MRDAGPEYRVKMVRFASGGRFPLVLDREGMPLWHPVAYLWRRRMRGRSVNTLEGNRTLARVHDFLAANGDFHSRVRKGRVLDRAEALDLSDHLRAIGPRTAMIRARFKETRRNRGGRIASGLAPACPSPASALTYLRGGPLTLRADLPVSPTVALVANATRIGLNRPQVTSHSVRPPLTPGI
jgi:hypothetical protein